MSARLPIGGHLGLVSAALLAAAIMSGCSRRHELLPSPAPAVDLASSGERPTWDGTRLHNKRMRVLSYRTRDGLEHAFDGFVKLEGDSLSFEPVAPVGLTTDPGAGDAFTLAADDVVSLTTLEAKEGALVLIIAVFGGLIWMAARYATH